MNTERLLLLADKLETVVLAEKFDLAGWRRNVGAVRAALNDHTLIRGCGTTACAVGWACAMPEFQVQGLRRSNLLLWREFEGETNWDAVELFLEISERSTLHLFMDDSYPNNSIGVTPSEGRSNAPALWK